MISRIVVRVVVLVAIDLDKPEEYFHLPGIAFLSVHKTHPDVTHSIECEYHMAEPS